MENMIINMITNVSTFLSQGWWAGLGVIVALVFGLLALPRKNNNEKKVKAIDGKQAQRHSHKNKNEEKKEKVRKFILSLAAICTIVSCIVGLVMWYNTVKTTKDSSTGGKELKTSSHTYNTMNHLEGSFSLILEDGNFMQFEGDATGSRNLKLASVEKMTYNIIETYRSGTKFRINFTSSQPAYVYVISTDSKHSPLAQLFPDPERNISAFLNFTSEVSVSIPDETQYIQLDETPGEDYLCIIYSKEELNMNVIKNSFQNNPVKSFVNIVNEVLADKIMNEKEVKFKNEKNEKEKIVFEAESSYHTAVPIFIKIKHG